MPKLTDEQKKFISSKYIDEKKQGKEIITLFNEKYEFMPSASTINKYLNYNEIVGEIEKEEKPKERKAEDIDIIVKDTRKLKGDVDFSIDDLDDEDFRKIRKAIGKSEYDTFELIQEAKKKGYKKINLETGVISK